METVGAATWNHSLKALRPGGTLVVAGATAGAEPVEDLRRIFFLQLRIIGSTMGTRDELGRLAQLSATSGVTPLVDATYPLEDAAPRSSACSRATSSARSSSRPERSPFGNLNDPAGVAQWQSSSLPSWLCEFDPRHPLSSAEVRFVMSFVAGHRPGPVFQLAPGNGSSTLKESGHVVPSDRRRSRGTSCSARADDDRRRDRGRTHGDHE